MSTIHAFSAPDRPLHDNFRLNAANYPGRPALIYYGAIVSYGALWRETAALAATLTGRLAVRPGDRVALNMQNCPQFIIAYYAVLLAGGVVVPLNPMYQPAEVERLLTDAGVRVVIAATELLDRFDGWAGAAGLAIVVARYADYLPADPVGPPPAIVASPAPIDAADSRLLSWTEALAPEATSSDNTAMARDDDLSTPKDTPKLQSGIRETGAMPGDPMDPRPRGAGEDSEQAPAIQSDLLCVLPYTSGSTGAPKGCPHTHAAVMHTAVVQAEWYGMDGDSVISAIQPLFHVAGMQGSMNAGIYAGATLLIMTRWDAVAAITLFARYGVTFFNAPPTMVVDVLSRPTFDDAAFARLKVITGGGAAMPVAVAARLQQRFGLTYVEGYGMSETMSPTHLNPMTDARPGSIGVPVPQTKSLIVDPDTLENLPDGAVGEILVAGPQVIASYWRNASADSFVDIDGVRMLRTGDLGRRDADGYFHVVDRLKRMINASGFKVWPAEVEDVLFAHDAVEQCCVFAAPDAYRGETVVAAIILKPEARGSVGQAELVAWVRARLAAFKAPRQVIFVDDLPRTASHKIDWRTVQQTLGHGREPSKIASA